MKNLLTFSNAKTSKGEAYGWRTAILYLAPASLSGENLCKFSTAECRLLCLNTAGRGKFNTIQQSRIRKTRWMLEQPELFWDRVCDEISNHYNYVVRWRNKHRRVLQPCVRLNGTSDIFTPEMREVIERHHRVQFYDYTKDTKRMLMWMAGELPSNYHLTYSFSGTKESQDFSDRVLQSGGNVAVVFGVKRGDKLPAYWRGCYDVIDGDKHDLRFLDQRNLVFGRLDRDEDEGVVVGLRAKGKAIGVVAHDKSFIQPYSDDRP